MNGNYIVYIHISPSGKRYVGITGQDINKRWRNGKGYFKNVYFARAINKYGWDNFKHEVVATELSKAEAETIEQQLIKKYKSNNKIYGYNIKSGGDSNGKHSDESKHLMSENRKGKGTGHRSAETKRRISEHHGGGAKSKPVRCIETGDEYRSINEACKAVGLTKKMISCCCRNVQHYKTAGGYHWEFIER